MPAAVRFCAVLLAVALLSACVSVPATTELCDAPPSTVVATELAGDSGCAGLTVASRFQTVGGVQQRGSQTRTVGVPPGFLVTLIVLLVIFALA